MDEIKEALVLDNMKLVHYVLNRFYPTWAREEDMIQVGMVGLCKAANAYDQSFGKFSGYAVVSIRNEIRNELKRRKKQPKTISLSAPVPCVGETKRDVTLEETLPGDIDVNYLDYDSLYSVLTPFEREVADVLRTGVNHYVAADKLGCSRSAVSMARRRIGLKWRQLL